MTRSFIISSGLITVNQWFEHSQNTAVGNVESLRSALEAEDGSSLGVGMAERSREKPAAPGSPAEWVRIWWACPLHELLLAFCGNSGNRRMTPAALGFACWALSCPCLCPGGCCRLRDVGRDSHAGLLMEQAASGREGCRSSPGQLPEG